MTKLEQIARIAKKTGVPQRMVRPVINELFKTIKEELLNDGHFLITGVGRLSVYERRARSGYDMVRKKRIQVPAKKCLRFRQSRQLDLEK